MKQQPLTGSVKDGMFKPQNPIKTFGPGNLCGIDDYDRWDREHPFLPIFTQSNTPVKDSEKVEAVGPVWQFYDNIREYGIVRGWVPCTDNNPVYAEPFGMQTRQCYILLEAPKESEEKSICGIDCKCNAVEDCPIDGSSRNWEEDFSHENGNYNSICVDCGNEFIGHKRRIVCNLCDTTPLSDKSDVDERADKLYPSAHINSIARQRQIGYIQGATDQEKLMQGEIDRLKSDISGISSYIEKRIEAQSKYPNLDRSVAVSREFKDLLTLLRNKQQ